jgi:hypothetical protein
MLLDRVDRDAQLRRYFLVAFAVSYQGEHLTLTLGKQIGVANHMRPSGGEFRQWCC